jgi:hypothetical protein
MISHYVNLSNDNINLIIIILLTVLYYLFYNYYYINNEPFNSNIPPIPGRVLNYKGNSNYTIKLPDESNISRPLIVGDMIYRNTIKSINENEIIMLSPKSFIFATRPDPNFIPGIVLNYIINGNMVGNYNIRQHDGSTTKRPLIIGDIMYENTIISISKKAKEIELTLKNIHIPGSVLDYEGNSNYIINFTNGSTAIRPLIVGDIIYKNTIKSINNNEIIISSPKSFPTESDPNFIPGTVTKCDDNGYYTIYQDNIKYTSNNMWTKRPLIVEDIMYEYTITYINKNEKEITLKKNE